MEINWEDLNEVWVLQHGWEGGGESFGPPALRWFMLLSLPEDTPPRTSEKDGPSVCDDASKRLSFRKK